MGSITPATSATHGPYRKVVRVAEETGQEVLECGHRGNTLRFGVGPQKKRRCLECRVPHCYWCGQPEREGDPEPILKDGPWGQEYHASCRAKEEAQDRAEEAWLARVREENLARRRAAGEDV